MKYFSRYISANFTQSELNEFVKEVGKIKISSNLNTVADDFVKIGAITSKFLNHENDLKQGRPKRNCYRYRPYQVARYLRSAIKAKMVGTAVYVCYEDFCVPFYFMQKFHIRGV